MSTPNIKFKSKADSLREQYPVNEAIWSKFGKVRVVDPETNKSQETDIKTALQMAQDKDVDLVQVSNNNGMPICKLMKFDKFIYQQEKAKKANAQHVKKNKLIKLSPNISDHDLEHKIKHIREFLADGFKVDLFLAFQGREKVHKEFGTKVFDKIVQGVGPGIVLEHPMKDNGNNLTMTLAKSK